MDPKLSSPLLGEIEGKVLGRDALIAKARKEGRLDYDAPFEGIKAIDRYTWQVRLESPPTSSSTTSPTAGCRAPWRASWSSTTATTSARTPSAPGPYRMAFWKRSSKMVFEKNPNFREEYFHGEPAADDARGQEILRQQKGKRMPMIDRIEVYVIEEDAAALALVPERRLDIIFKVPEEFANQGCRTTSSPRARAQGHRHGAGAGARPHLQLLQHGGSDVGGYTPEK
jgi:ABC-type transport system substrate-binding protein